jgi:hypothetical protein
MRPSSKSTELSRRRFLRNAAGWALAGGIFVPRLIRASAFTDNVTQYLGANSPMGPYMPSPANLKGWWLMAGNGNDSSGNGATLNFNATPTFVTGQSGVANTAYVIGATSSDWASVTAPACNGYSEFSLSFWFYLTACGNMFGRLWEKGANNEITVTLNYNTSCNQLAVQTLGSNTLAAADSSISLNTWYNCLVTFATGSPTGTVFLNINGVSIGSGVSATGATNNTIYVGTYGGSPGTDQAIGYMQDIRFWNSPLNGSQAMQLYAAGAATQP